MADVPIYGYFRPDSMVLLITHPKQATLVTAQRELLMTWVRNKAKEILPDVPEPIQFAAVEHDFTFPPAVGSGKAQSISAVSSETGQPQSGALEALHKIEERIEQAIDRVEDRIEGEPAAPKIGEAPGRTQAAGVSAAAEGAPAGQLGRPNITAHPPFTVMFPTVKASPANLVKLAKGLHDQRKSLEADVVLEQVALNWLANGGDQGAPGGGPGGRPSAVTPLSAHRHSFRLPLPLETLLDIDSPRGGGVEVAILDTAPSDDDMKAAYSKWVNKAPTPHPLMKTLLGTNGKLTAKHQNLDRLKGRMIEHHEYVMSDHGLFVAGIIHSIAPYAELHLWEVLNDHGIGDTDSIASGLFGAAGMIVDQIAAGGSHKWVVNCSLMTGAPRNDADLDYIIQEFVDRKGLTPDEARERDELVALLKSGKTNPQSGMNEWLLDQSSALVYICDFMYSVLHTRVVAAAGNDRDETMPDDEPPARFLACADSVLGVGALTKDNKPASYSNEADCPADSGVITFGGEKGRTGGVLGAYIGSFPVAEGPAGVGTIPDTNDTGWASWAGTSFATPIVSGVTAALLSIPGAYATTQDAIDVLFDPANRLPGDDGFFLDVKQL